MKSSGNRKRFVVMRHEVTQENRIGLIQGQSVGGTLVSREINPEKIKWCKKNVLLPAVIVSSSASRCVESATLLADLLDLPMSQPSQPLIEETHAQNLAQEQAQREDALYEQETRQLSLDARGEEISNEPLVQAQNRIQEEAEQARKR